ncbi:ATP-binding protein [Kutzneria sp. CA-103260]|uniref:ATP-binding protein n=1 Tax=Kutzneria sp. CA-103260 TaxID=2802641 RepID=UPI001BF0907B|nr:helix-turn-helix transcriptional regulator [Kutzneria sp. CA-103260]QUQ67006.1 transcriptional regulator [Kutzneria sp. CA-103260]
MLLGRRREQETLDRLVRDVRDGRSRVLVLRGEAGAGKTALLDYVAGTMPAERVSRAVGVESESEIAYATLQRLCVPLMTHVDRLPAPQREALLVGLGERAGAVPDALHVGLAVLGLFAEAAAERPLLCVVDDVQWLDKMSEVILTFVARRLDAESVALVFASRDEELLDGLPELRVDGLPDGDARALLDSVLPGPVDARIRDRIVAETHGNPLALLELPRGRTPAELAFGLGGRTTAPIPNRIEQGFQRRIAELSQDTRTLLLAAAVEPLGDVPLLWRALERLNVTPDAAAPAESAELLELGARVRFRHPLVRSASWRSATPAELRAVHGAFADVTDPQQDPDRRAWHRAHATLGLDDEVAAELAQSADRARSRGGHAAAAAFLERAAELTADPKPRAARAFAAAQARFAAGQPAKVPELLAAAELGPLDPLHQAEVERLRAQVAFAVNRGRAAGPPLLAAARRLADLDLAAARETYLAAFGAAVHAGDHPRPAAEAGRALPAGDDPAGLLLTGLAAWALDGYVAALPSLRRALCEAPLLLVAPVAQEIWDDQAWQRITETVLAETRVTGALSVLPTSLTARAGALLADLRLTDAAALLDEVRTLREATGLAGDPFAELTLLALQGKEKPAVELIETVTRDADERGERRLTAMADHALAVLNNGLGRYAAAQAAAARVGPHLGISPWTELVEAAIHAGDIAAATEARDRLAEHTGPAGTDWALGTQALADALVAPSDDKFREAIDRLPLALPAARARLLYGEWLRRENRRADARDQLRPAHEAFLAAGAGGFAERAGRELAATGETVRKRGGGAVEELTPQEAQIARLAVAGRTNPEIAAALFLSPRTVEWHLRKVFTKLGITSRRELATSSL